MLRHCCELMLSILDGDYGWQSEILSLILVVIIFSFLAKWVLKRLHRRFEKQKKIWKDSFVQALYAPLNFYTWFFAFFYATNLIIPKEYSETYLKSLHLILVLTAILTLSWFILRWKKTLIRLMIAKSKNREITIDHGRIDAIDKMLTVLIIFLTILLLLEASDRSINTLIAFGGIGGLALAFASQEIIANFFGGLMIYATQPFSIGDCINLPEKNIEGQVEEIGWYMTRVRTLEKRPLYIPNSTFTRIVVMNPSRMSCRQFKEVIALRYCDLGVIKPVMEDIAAMLYGLPGIARDQKIIVALDTVENAALNISITAYTITTDTEEFGQIKQEIWLRIIDIVTKHGAEISFPTTTIEIPHGVQMVSAPK